MVIIGGVGSFFGLLIGILVYVILEEVLFVFMVYWYLIFGIFLVVLVLFGKGGIYGWLVLLDCWGGDYD